DASPRPFHVSHVADRHGIHATDGRIERHAAEDLDPLCSVLANELSETGRFRPVVLEDDAAHAPLLRELHDLERVPLPGVAVGSVMCVQVDGPDERGIGELLIDRWLWVPGLIRFPVRLW